MDPLRLDPLLWHEEWGIVIPDRIRFFIDSLL
jgi:hypothetical protein